MATTLHVTSLYIYPIKSCRGIAVDNAVLTECGLQWDRYWVIVEEENHKILTQRTHPKMVLIHPRLDVGANQVTGIWLSTLDQKDIWLTSQPAKDAPITTIHASTGPIDGIDLGDEAAQWVSQFLECRVRVLVKAGKPRSVESDLPKDTIIQRHLSPQTAFADVFPCLLTSKASLCDLNGRLEKQIDMCRFRPNIVVSGNENPFAEDAWVGSYLCSNDNNHEFYVASRCPRCTLPNVDPDEGVALEKEPFKTLQSYRRVDPQFKYNACFGVNLIPVHFGDSIHIGDTLQVQTNLSK